MFFFIAWVAQVMAFLRKCGPGHVLQPTSESVAQVMSYLRKCGPGHVPFHGKCGPGHVSYHGKCGPSQVLPQKVWASSCPTSESVA